MKKNKLSSIKFLPFKEARIYARSSGAKSQKQWAAFFKNKRPKNIPSTPQREYKNSGWISWMDWLDTTNKPYWPSRKEYRVNDSFFKKWSESMAYVLGLWWADGWIYKNRMGIIQHKADSYLLRDILKQMGSDYGLGSNRRHNCMTIEIYSSTIVESIKKLGGLERKSLTIGFPRVPIKYLPDFIRGLWDGDGCITFDKNKKCFLASFVGASKKMIIAFLSKLREEIPDLRGALSTRGKGEKRKNDLYVISFSKNDTVRLGRYMYRGYKKKQMGLKRKYDKFKKSGPIVLQGEWVRS